jgi:hypothetical protein
MNAIISILAAGAITSSVFGISNGSFEQGFDGWALTAAGGNYYDSAEVPVWYRFPGTTNPFFSGSWRTEPGGLIGNEFARLQWFGYGSPGPQFTGPDGNLYYFDSEMNRVTIGVYQDIALTSGQRIFGYARFGTAEAGPEFRDRSRITVNGESVWGMEVSDIWGRDQYAIAPTYSGWQSPWELWEFTASQDGVYRLQLELNGDDQLTSWGDFDGFEIATTVGGAGGLPQNVPDTGATAIKLGIVLLGLFVLRGATPNEGRPHTETATTHLA